MRAPERPRSPMGVLFGGAAFAAAILGWFWIGELIAAGAGWRPVAEAGRQIAQAVRP